METLTSKEIEELLAAITESTYYYSESENIGPFFNYNGYEDVEEFGASFSKYQYQVRKHRKLLCQNQNFISRLEDFMFGFSDVPIRDNDHVMAVHALSHFWSEDKGPFEEGRSNIRPTKEIRLKGAKFIGYQRQQLIAIIRILNEAKSELENEAKSELESSTKAENSIIIASPVQFKLKDGMDRAVFMATLALTLDVCLVTKQQRVKIANTFAPYFNDSSGPISENSLERIFSFATNRISDDQLAEVETILKEAKENVDELLQKLKGIHEKRNK